jgi:hypothetical protein
MGWLRTAFLLALVAIAALLGIVVYLFIRWRNTGPRTAAMPLPEKKFQEAGDTPFETTIAEGGKVVIGEGPATLMSHDSTNVGNVGPTYGELFPEIVSLEGSEANSTGDKTIGPAC